MKERFRVVVKRPPKEVLPKLIASLNNRSNIKDLWKRFYCKKTGYTFQVFVALGFGVWAGMSNVIVQGKVEMRGGDSEVTAEFDWGWLVKFFLICFIIMGICLSFTMYAMENSEFGGADLPRVILILALAHLFLFVLLAIPPFIYLRRALVSVLKEIRLESH